MNRNFFVPGPPQGKARPRVITQNGRTHAYTPRKTAEYEEKIRQCYLARHAMRPDEKRPVGVFIQAIYPIPKRANAKDRDAMLHGAIKPIKKPDLDNVLKAVLDALNGIAWADDAQVCYQCAEKLYGERPGLDVNIICEEDGEKHA